MQELIDPTPLDTLVDYQTDAIVSRILMKKRAGSVTAFAFDAGQELSEHTTPFDALVLGIGGVGVIRIGDRTVQLHEGEAVLLPANVPHAVRAEQAFKMTLVMLKEKG